MNNDVNMDDVPLFPNSVTQTNGVGGCYDGHKQSFCKLRRKVYFVLGCSEPMASIPYRVGICTSHVRVRAEETESWRELSDAR